jgi:broad specificity phosphatase PhoE
MSGRCRHAGGPFRVGFGLSLVVCALAWAPSRAEAQSLVYVVRHAERADAGSTSTTMTSAPADPSLSAAGAARAQKLAALLADAGIRAIYATEFKRTQQTVEPLAAKLGQKVIAMPAADTAALVASMKATYAHDVVLVAGHSNTVPAIIKALGGPDVTIGENEYDSLFVVVPATGAVSRIRY